MSANFKIKFLSSLEKCFLDETIDEKPETKEFFMFRNQKLAFQAALCDVGEPERRVRQAKVIVKGPLAEFISVKRVTSLPSVYAASAIVTPDENYLRTAPGLYPDLIEDLQYRGKIRLPHKTLMSLWFEVRLPQGFAGGDYETEITLEGESGEEVTDTVKISVISQDLAPQKTVHTEWFYADCLAEYYGVDVFSAEHWKIIENFIKTAGENGINLLLTPVFTPELDTYIGGERLTTQLVDIEVTAPGKYRFGYEKLAKWMDICLANGIERFEIPHFFTQWGAKNAPKFVGTVNGKEEKLFGWETDALGEEYRGFLSQFIPALIEFFRARGLDKNLYFHVSDEPRITHLEHYIKCKNLIAPYLEGHTIMDALSDYEFYESGALNKPIPSIAHAQPFLDNKTPDLWVYYCGPGGTSETTNRSFAMTLANVRILGVQMCISRVTGFLHWGYNYYNNQYSYDTVNPFLDTCANCFAPSGDAYLVYPGNGGKPLESLRLNAMREAMEDIRMLELCESLRGREFTEKLLLEAAGGELTFRKYPKGTEGAVFFETLVKRIAAAVGDTK